MYTHSAELIEEAFQIGRAFRLEPGVQLDLAAASVPTIAAVMYCLMWRGLDEPGAIYDALRRRGCRYDTATIDFVLSIYEGQDPRRHLWSRDDNEGFYVPLFDPVAGGEDLSMY